MIAIYFTLVFGVAIWSYLQERGDESAAGYFLGGGALGRRQRGDHRGRSGGH